ncbi:hypothetical protein DICPUDRAFT_27499 [Dictyostelium purpureum]|uniref:Malonyl-CoA:ACP transacylase (MAT) domain-containing protein n=1 Tax=Dictyostelium purpureum TaxID=5786 RepID=F0ZAB6_DICPU|nr:uncharacterized protein DICPUDRAFT_27499 [Dictyostelium purpureum]EGC39095.1 hypothetical protein DICPUDRAFT_27499 [Dictyostelium purpureum]|eukprot:XP_003284347.1 hypothetical protein DICPUDRAFT_27499 [Dictyostelium purpureum]
MDNIKNQPFIVFVFSGQGAQWNKMVLEVYECEKVFRDSMDEIDNIMKEKYYGYSVLDKLKTLNDELDPEINSNQEITQTALLMVQVSLYKLYKHLGLLPNMIVGHSFGEVVGSYASGMIPDLETLCYIIYNRGKLQQTTFGCGRTMMWIDLGEHEYMNQFSKQFPTIEIACLLSPTNIVIGGETADIEKINSVLKSKSIYTKVLSIPTAFHNSCQDVLKDDILKLKFKSNPPLIPHSSTVYGKLFNEELYFNNQYMFDNLRDQARFAHGISAIYKHVEENKLGDNIVFVEIGPRPSILNYVKKLIPKESSYFSSVSLLCSIQRDKGTQAINEMLNSVKLKGYNNLI